MITLLFVDDEPMNISTFVRTFGKFFTITTANSGVTALSELQKSSFEAVVTDYAMPGMTGLELLERVKELYPASARLIITAHWDLAILTNARRHGLAADVLSKPWEKAELVAVVQRAVADAHGIAAGVV